MGAQPGRLCPPARPTRSGASHFPLPAWNRGGRCGTILRTTNWGATWSRQSASAFERLSGVSFTSANTEPLWSLRAILRTVNAAPPGRLSPAAPVTVLRRIFHQREYRIRRGRRRRHPADHERRRHLDASVQRFRGSLFAISFADAGAERWWLRRRDPRTTNGGSPGHRLKRHDERAFCRLLHRRRRPLPPSETRATIILRPLSTRASRGKRSQGCYRRQNRLHRGFLTIEYRNCSGWSGTILRTRTGAYVDATARARRPPRSGGVSFADADTGTVVGESAQSSGPRTGAPPGPSVERHRTKGSEPSSHHAPIPGPWWETTHNPADYDNRRSTWSSQSSGTLNGLHGVSFADANTGTIVGYASTILRTTTARYVDPSIHRNPLLAPGGRND